MSAFITVLISAGTSAGVALAVEWMTKPRLEARKERILKRYRARDDVWRALDSVLFAAVKMKNMPTSMDDDIQAAGAEIVPATKAFEEVFREVMPFTGHRIIGLMRSYVGIARGVMTSDRTAQEKGTMLTESTSMIMDVLRGPGEGSLYWARRRYRERRARELEALAGS